MIIASLFLIPQVDKGVVPLAGTSGETTTQGQTCQLWFSKLLTALISARGTHVTRQFIDVF